VLGGTWNRNGDILLGGLFRVQRVSAAGGVVSNLPQHSATGTYPFFLPDGRHYLAIRGAAGSTQAGVWVSSMDGPETRHILPDTSNAEIIEPPPGSQVGAVLFTRAGTLMALPFDMKRLEAAGDAVPVAQGLWLAQLLTGWLRHPIKERWRMCPGSVAAGSMFGGIAKAKT
jgi:hypothetical protein